MRERIKQIMDNEHLSPSEFADKLGIGRAVISHILNGRNNPSLDVVTRILSKINWVNPEWLITGEGNMSKNDNQNVSNDKLDSSINKNQPDLFSQNLINQPLEQEESKYRKEIIVERPQEENKNTVKEEVIYKKSIDKKISKIIIYYTDNTFETFTTDNQPL